jgi:hypothetical protein
MSPIYRKLLKSVAKAISIPTLTPTFIPIWNLRLKYFSFYINQAKVLLQVFSLN